MIKFINYNVLIIDDDSAVRESLLTSIKRLNNVNVDLAENLQIAISKIHQKVYHLIICDYYLKPGTALEILDLVKQVHPTTPIIIINGGSEDEKKKSLENGATVFFSKPYDYLELTYVVKNILALYEANENLETAENIIIALSKAIDAKDSYTEGHSQRVAQYAIKIYDRIGLDDDNLRKSLYIGCILHDIGKIAIPDYILKSTNHPLNEEEFNLVKIHPIKGYEICKDLENLKDALLVIRNHHEKLNGSGYPDGLKEDEIPLYVQIATIADLYDALTSKRSYCSCMSHEEALKIIEEDVEKGEISGWLLSILKKIIKDEENVDKNKKK